LDSLNFQTKMPLTLLVILEFIFINLFLGGTNPKTYDFPFGAILSSSKFAAMFSPPEIVANDFIQNCAQTFATENGLKTIEVSLKFEKSPSYFTIEFVSL
jgi:hypothetical protein